MDSYSFKIQTEVINIMTDNKRIIEDEKSKALRASILGDIPEEVRKKIANVCSDVELCKILADNGIDVEKLEKKIADAGIDIRNDGLQLPDSELDHVAGGFQESMYEGDLTCDCGNSNSDDFSKQCWASWFSSRRYYRCKKCNRYIIIYGPRKLCVTDEEEMKQDFYSHWDF
jgi:hypothetical protein